MTGDKPDPSEVLARARRAWSPSPADAGRVRRAIAAAVLGGPAAGEGAAPAGQRALPRAPAWASRFLIAGAIAATSGGVGYWAGHRAGLRAAPPAAPAVSLAPARVAEPASGFAPRPASGTPSVAMPSPVPARHGAQGGRHESQPRTPLASESLTLEVRALRNAERALRDGNSGLALAFLQELDRQVPNGQLTEERDAAATLARCARGDRPFGVNLGADFADRHPDSVYRARVEQACGETDSPGPGDSRPGRTER